MAPSDACSQTQTTLVPCILGCASAGLGARRIVGNVQHHQLRSRRQQQQPARPLYGPPTRQRSIAGRVRQRERHRKWQPGRQAPRRNSQGLTHTAGFRRRISSARTRLRAARALSTPLYKNKSRFLYRQWGGDRKRTARLPAHPQHWHLVAAPAHSSDILDTATTAPPHIATNATEASLQCRLPTKPP